MDPFDEERLRPLPAEAQRLLARAGAPPRLLAHSRLVCDTAAQVLDALAERHPGLPVDAGAVLFGAAVHDIGKTVHPEELSVSGHRHEPAGAALLAGYGVPPELARFCALHADWEREAATLEELLVSLADKVWKGARVESLELRVVRVLAAASGRPEWEVFAALDDALTAIARHADARLAYQARHPVAG
ncbi:HD domain-containing protein [Allonocardiopsis opalescens]|uniref:Putative nucleotidyltransferase with HDIG domain n=1 Tax=Allonocardiopsis opalescens TaxID=1144618 RepID=A0A2T0PTC3_9ACTN|nr:HD domain-containing protein [Allonocardiopsis opalescens]PRX92149.1 putative nucleotidyltransferase with HDIG domain [Allonocardiopsis opalescens]